MTLLSRKSPRKPMKRKSWMKKSSKPMPKRNPKKAAKRKAGYRKMLRSKEYLDAKAEAMERAGYRCEHTGKVVVAWTTVVPGVKGSQTLWQRCISNSDLEAHHLRYPKSRKLRADDLKILCRFHHEYAESEKMHKQRMF